MAAIDSLSELPASGGEFCPHLGLEEDEQTCLAYPSPWNLCHHCKPAAAVHLSHQKKMCLGPAYAECPAFQSTELLPLPKDIRCQHARPASRG